MAGKFALLIGNSRFTDKALARLAAPENDVIALREVLRNPQISGFETTLVLNAGMDEARTAVAKHYQNRQPDDLLLFYYTGHGLRGDDGELYLSLGQTDSQTPSAISLEASYVRAQMDRSRSKRQLAILDCCHSGAFIDDVDDETAKRASDQTQLFQDDFVPKGRGSFVLAASSANQSAFEKDGKSLFTQYLVEALETGQAAPDNADISVQDLYGYVSDRVASVTERMRPKLWPEEANEPLYIARNLDPRTPIPPELLQMLWDEDPHRAYGAVHQLISIYREDDEQRSADVERAFLQRLEQAATLPHLVAKPIEDALTPVQTASGDPLLVKELEKERQARSELNRQIAELRSSAGKQPNRPWLTPLSGSVVAVSLAISAIAGLAAISPDAFDRMARSVFPEGQPASNVLELQQERDRLQEQLIEVRAEQEQFDQQRAEMEEQIAALSSSTAASDELETRVAELQAALEQSLAQQAELSAALAAVQNQTSATHAPLSIFTACADCPEMIAIPAGTFLMGSPEDEEGRWKDEGPQRAVIVQKFAIAKTEVTFDQWQACVDDGGCQSNREPSDRGWGKGSLPVINVSWNDAQEYIAWLNTKVEGNPYRLPSEAEWEYAARAGTTGRFSNNGGEVELCEIGNHADRLTSFDWKNRSCSDGVGEQTAVVGSYKPNEFGLHDMHGNVWEWVEDVYESNYATTPTDGSAHIPQPLSEDLARVVRGGSWSGNPQLLRSAVRGWNGPDNRYNNLGFRPARTLVTP